MDASEDAEQFFETAATTTETSSHWVGTDRSFPAHSAEKSPVMNDPKAENPFNKSVELGSLSL